MKQPWVVILAAGDGERLASVTARSDGVVVPKQFCALCSDRSMLAMTLDRARRLVPMERIVVVVADQHRCWWRREVTELPWQNVVVQPANRGTAAGLLLGLLRVHTHDAGATVVILPSDHFVEDEERLQLALGQAVRTAGRLADKVVLLGIGPEEPDSGYGWIVASRDGHCGARRVLRFVEKPGRAEAVELMESGALWSSFMMAARLPALMGLYRRALPRLLDAMNESRAGLPVLGDSVRNLYASLPMSDASRDLLQTCADALLVQRVSGLGWSDLGTPERLRRLGLGAAPTDDDLVGASLAEEELLAAVE